MVTVDIREILAGGTGRNIVLAPETRRAAAFKSLDEARASLKAVRNYEDFKVFLFKLEHCTGYFHHVDLCAKRSGYSTQAHDPYQYNAAKCHYLVCDGKSHGLCRWENLYKVLEVRIQWLNESGVRVPDR